MTVEHCFVQTVNLTLRNGMKEIMIQTGRDKQQRPRPQQDTGHVISDCTIFSATIKVHNNGAFQRDNSGKRLVRRSIYMRIDALHRHVSVDEDMVRRGLKDVVRVEMLQCGLEKGG